jgi:PTH1 family peptidyl-tRNA hydrolase
MNILGPSLRPFMKALPPNSPDTAYFIIYDHLDKDEGYIQVRKGGSANGHNGMRSCLHTLGEHKENVWQVRLSLHFGSLSF